MHTLLARLGRWVQSKPQATVVTLLGSGNAVSDCWTYADLERGAQRIAQALNSANARGLPVLLSAEPTFEFICALCGCLYAGAIATPVPPLTRKHGSERLQAIIIDAGVRHAIACGPASELIRLRCPELQWIDPLFIGPAVGAGPELNK